MKNQGVDDFSGKTKKRGRDDEGEQQDDLEEQGIASKKQQSIIGLTSWSHAQQSGLNFVNIELEKIKDKLQAPKPGQIVGLPLPPFGNLTSRFVNLKEGGVIPCIQRKAFMDLRKRLDEKEGLIYVNGPQGFGKSFALYHLFCSLRLDDNYRVIYIGNCAKLMKNAYVDLGEAFAAGFAEDDKFLKNILPLLDPLQPQWREFIKVLDIHCKSTNKIFVAIFDQHNGLKGEARSTEPTHFALWPDDLPGARIIVSASANNEDAPLKMADKKADYWFGEGYTDDELKAWQTKHNFFAGENLSEVTKVTQNIPFELDSMVNCIQVDLATTIQTYVSIRTDEITYSHTKFVRSLTEEERYQYNLCLTYICTGRPYPVGTELVYDRQLFYKSKNRLLSVLPMALEIALSKNTFDMESFVKDFFTKTDASNSARGDMVEFYILHRINRVNAFRLCVMQVMVNNKKNQSPTAPRCDIAVENCELVHFEGASVPPPHLKPKRNTILIPNHNNYPDIDFFAWDDEKKELWPVQITVSKTPGQHPNTWEKSALKKAWLNWLNVKQSKPKVWITADDFSDTSHNGQYFFNIQDLTNRKSYMAELQALKHFVRVDELRKTTS